MDSKFEFDAGSDDDSDVENYLPGYRRRKQGASTDADCKPSSVESSTGLGSAVKGSELDDSDEDEDDYARETKATTSSAPSKPPLRGLGPPVAQSKDVDDNFDDFGSAKSAAVHTSTADGGKASLDQRRGAMLRCCARGGDTPDTHEMQQCFIVRDRNGTNYMSPVYRLYREPPAGEDRSRATFLASARKRVLKGGSNFLISLESTPTDRTSDGIVGKLRGDWSGGQYTIYDHGLNPAKTQNKRLIRRELGLVQFEYDQTGPGTLRAVLPMVSAAGVIDVWQPDDPEQTIAGVMERGNRGRAGDGAQLLVLENKRPHWDETQKGHVLNFQGRVTQSSVKNFQLRCEAISGDLTVLQFGRVDKNTFTMDYAHPLCALQAFAMCLSVFDGKVSDFKDLETMLGAKPDTKLDDEVDGGYGQSSRRVEGSMTGSRGLFGNLSERIPTRQYLADKVKRFSS